MPKKQLLTHILEHCARYCFRGMPEMHLSDHTVIRSLNGKCDILRLGVRHLLFPQHYWSRWHRNNVRQKPDRHFRQTRPHNQFWVNLLWKLDHCADSNVACAASCGCKRGCCEWKCDFCVYWNVRRLLPWVY